MKRKTTQQFVDEATILHSGRYDYVKTDYISSWKKVIILCNVHGDFLQAPANHLKGQGCPQCMAIEKFDTLRLTNEEIDVDLLKADAPIKRISDYINVITNIEWECLLCNNRWFITPNHIRKGGGCPKCKDTRLSNSDIDRFIIEHVLPLKRIGEYINAYIKINWQCLMCDHIWLAQPCEIKRLGEGREGSGCPECARGKNEKRVGEVLDQLRITHKKLRIDLLTGQKMFPDFYLPEHNMIIEYNGIQHYRPTCFGSMKQVDAEKSFQRQQNRDNLLRQYCQERQIILLEIDGRKYKGTALKKLVFDYFMNEVNYV